MDYQALAADYDGTLATKGSADSVALAALRRLRASGRKLILVTGRELPDLKSVFPGNGIFHRIVAENGALLYRPESGKEVLLCDPVPEEFLEGLRERGIPFSAGQAIVATREPHQTTVLDVIHKLGLELQVIFNKGAVMVLPSGVNKATGLKNALEEFSIRARAAVAVGDGENDHALLAASGFGVAVANAVPLLKQHADMVTRCANGAGVAELAEHMIAGTLPQRRTRRD